MCVTSSNVCRRVRLLRMRRHVPVPLTTVKGNCWAFHYQTPRYYGQTLQSTRSKTVVGGGRVEPDMQDKYEEATRSALQRACGPAGVIELARDGSLAPAGGGAEAMALKHTQDKPAEKATPRAGIVPEMPAPALLNLARVAVGTLLPHDPHCSVRTLQPHDCCCCLMCTPRAALQPASQTAGRSPRLPKAAAQHTQSRVRNAYAPFAFRFRSAAPVLPHEMYGA